MTNEEKIQKDAGKMFDHILAKELHRGATDNQAYDRARRAADQYADDVSK